MEWLAQDKVDNNSNWNGRELLQRYVLRVLYHSTNGDNWSNSASTSWFIGGSSVCQWPGEGSLYHFCYNRYGGQEVNAIVLDFDNLQGELPDELGQLTSLEALYLHNNQLTGTIPWQLGELTALTTLTFNFNQLSGTIPTQLGQLTALSYLYLHANKLTGTIPLTLTQLTNMRNLYLHNNNLTGQMPSGFCAAPFPDWRNSFDSFWSDCMSEVQCDCCDRCLDESGNFFCWDGSGFTSNAC